MLHWVIISKMPTSIHLQERSSTEGFLSTHANQFPTPSQSMAGAGGKDAEEKNIPDVFSEV